METLVKADPPLIQEAWYRIQGWYKAAVELAPPPARVMLKRITAERVALYSRVLPSGDNNPVEIEPFEVEDKVPDEGGIEWAFKRLRKKPLRGGVADAGGAPQGMACGGTERREGINHVQGGGRPVGHTGGCRKLGEGRGTSVDGV